MAWRECIYTSSVSGVYHFLILIRRPLGDFYMQRRQRVSVRCNKSTVGVRASYIARKVSEREMASRSLLAPNWDKAITFWALLLPNAINHFCAPRHFTYPLTDCCISLEYNSGFDEVVILRRRRQRCIGIRREREMIFHLSLQHHPPGRSREGIEISCAWAVYSVSTGLCGFTHMLSKSNKLLLNFNVYLISGKSVLSLNPKSENANTGSKIDQLYLCVIKKRWA
jgi:hypothetical protein